MMALARPDATFGVDVVPMELHLAACGHTDAAHSGMNQPLDQRLERLERIVHLVAGRFQIGRSPSAPPRSRRVDHRGTPLRAAPR